MIITYNMHNISIGNRHSNININMRVKRIYIMMVYNIMLQLLSVLQWPLLAWGFIVSYIIVPLLSTYYNIFNTLFIKTAVALLKPLRTVLHR